MFTALCTALFTTAFTTTLSCLSAGVKIFPTKLDDCESLNRGKRNAGLTVLKRVVFVHAYEIGRIGKDDTKEKNARRGQESAESS